MSCKITKTTCPHCGEEINSVAASKHIATCAKRPPKRELLRMYAKLGKIRLVAAELGVSPSTVHRWLHGRRSTKCDARLDEIHESAEPVYPIEPERFNQWGGCDSTCDHWNTCRDLPMAWPTPCMAVTAGDVRLLVSEYGWRPPAHVAAAMEAQP